MTGNENTISNLTASQRRLKAVVIILGALIVLAIAALIIGAVVKLGHGKAAISLPGTPFHSDLALALGESVISADLKEGRLLVRLKAAEGEEIVILDAASGRELGRVHVKSQP